LKTLQASYVANLLTDFICTQCKQSTYLIGTFLYWYRWRLFFSKLYYLFPPHSNSHT